MQNSFDVVIIIAHISSRALPISILLLVIAAVLDGRKKRFHWLKYAIALFLIVFILFMGQLLLIDSLLESN